MTRPFYRVWTIQESRLLTPDFLEIFLRRESESESWNITTRPFPNSIERSRLESRVRDKHSRFVFCSKPVCSITSSITYGLNFIIASVPGQVSANMRYCPTTGVPRVPRPRPGPRPKWNYPGQNENTQACSNGNCGVTGGRGDLGEFKVEAKVIVKAKVKVKSKGKNLGKKLTA